jgi:membrane fusion protein (multidrug efflux system)
MAMPLGNLDRRYPRVGADDDDTILSPPPFVDRSDHGDRTEGTRAPRRRRYRAVVVWALVLLGAGDAALLGGRWLLGRHHQTSEDAHIEARTLQITPKVSGQVLKVHVRDNQLVEANQLLVELDHHGLEARLEAARADLEAARAAQTAAHTQATVTEKRIAQRRKRATGGLEEATSGLVSSGASMSQAERQFAAAKARVQQAQRDLDGALAQHDKRGLPLAEVEARRVVYQQAVAELGKAEERFAAARTDTAGARDALLVARERMQRAASAEGGEREQLAIERGAVDVANARVTQATVAVKLAELALAATWVRAPARGVVWRRMILISPDDLWVVANFRDDQIDQVRVGAPARIRVPAIGNSELSGHVESLASGPGTRCASLSPEAAGGSVSKTTSQQVPVRIRIDNLGGLALRPGFSAVATVQTAQPVVRRPSGG